MDIDEITELVAGMPGVVTLVPEQGSGHPEIAWGDSFFFYNPAGNVADAKRQPFATIVVKDYPDADEFSRLDRPGAYRLNISVGRTTFTELLGYGPKEHAEHHDAIDYTVADRLLPHPLYAALGWVAIVNPGPATAERIRSLLRQAHDQDMTRYHRRSPAQDPSADGGAASRAPDGA